MNGHSTQKLPTGRRFTVGFHQLQISDVALVGGKCASLAEMHQTLLAEGVRIPDGFAITSEGYRHFLQFSGLEETLDEILDGLNTDNIHNLQRKGAKVRSAILGAQMPEGLKAEICDAYARLGGQSNPLDVAVRSSATTEDLPSASFAGQFETFLNVRGDEALISCCIKAFASLYTDRAISYRCDMGIPQTSASMAVAVQRMVRSDLAASGAMLTLDPESDFHDVVLVNAAYGIGESVLQGSVNPDEYCVFKPTLKKGFRPIVRKLVGTKEHKVVYDPEDDDGLRTVPVAPDKRGLFAITDDDVIELSRWACLIEDHYSRKAGCLTHMDIEWAKDGVSGELYILQAKPETASSWRLTSPHRVFTLSNTGALLLHGRRVGDQIGTGPVKIVKDERKFDEFQQGDVLVADETTPKWEPIMKKAAAIVTNRGGRTCHAAIVSRELGVPAVIGTGEATARLIDRQPITVSCAEGDEGKVYEGHAPYEVREKTRAPTDRPRTKIMLNIERPEEAFSLSTLPVDGVGLVTMDFIMLRDVKIHPMALIAYDEGTLTNVKARSNIEALTTNHPVKSDYFVEGLAQGVGTIAAAFFPKDVIVRFSDLRSDQFSDLLLGNEFEAAEPNPVLGLRGASRYLHPNYQAGFALECRAIQAVRKTMGLKNLKVMIPFCRTVEEAILVLAEMARHGLKSEEDNLEIYMMCEVPSNLILADQFAAVFDGLLIESSELEQFILGFDRNSEVLAGVLDATHAAMRRIISKAISVCHDFGTKVGVCSKATVEPWFARFVVQSGADLISLNPDALGETSVNLQKQESALYV